MTRIITPHATAKVIRDALAGYPDDALVYLEGCDCYGQAAGVEPRGDGNLVIRRFGGVDGVRGDTRYVKPEDAEWDIEPEMEG